MKTTKAELEKKVTELEKQLKSEKSRPTGHCISNVNIDMTDQYETKLAVAKAVEQGMKALQSLGEGNSYGVYLAN